MNYDLISEHFGNSSVAQTEEQKLTELMKKDNVTESQLRELLAGSKNYEENKPLSEYAHKLVSQWDKILTKLNNSLF